MLSVSSPLLLRHLSLPTAVQISYDELYFIVLVVTLFFLEPLNNCVHVKIVSLN